ncbi:putative prophage protein [Klebsiella pneumoniae subsp. pneumoniae]|uniref:Putative prophage protein n=1 Tax=Klebsiella pneumoniae subsp. pneumoniae TaxID=72407 RepID=A0A377Z806_KLEPN|nr:putative prophage protein [Klebsiella pneumoniae subsp. pneumoniae]STW51490.1 putative prophage protein [Klebsiella pneumoniae]
MAIEGDSATVPLSPGHRLDGLNHIAEIRAKVFGLNIEPELERFISDMRDQRDIYHKQNERALAAIFFMAKIPADRHNVNMNELTTDEKRELIKAMNHFRAVVSLFPKRLTMPN